MKNKLQRERSKNMRKEFMEIMNQSKSEAEINNKKNKEMQDNKIAQMDSNPLKVITSKLTTFSMKDLNERNKKSININNIQKPPLSSRKHCTVYPPENIENIEEDEVAKKESLCSDFNRRLNLMPNKSGSSVLDQCKVLQKQNPQCNTVDNDKTNQSSTNPPVYRSLAKCPQKKCGHLYSMNYNCFSVDR